MYLKNRLLQIIAITIVGVLIIAACAPQQPQTSPEPVVTSSGQEEQTSPPEEPTTPTEEPTDAPAQESVRLSIWTRFPEIEALLKDLAAAYENQNPNVEIEVTLFAQRALDEKIAVALPSGEAADLIEIDGVSMFTYHNLGVLEPVPDELVSFSNEHLVSSLVEENTDENGVIYATSFFVGVQALFYNQDHFAEAGLEGCPETIEELLDYAQKLTKYDAEGNITRAGLDLRLGGGGYGVAEKYWAMSMVPYGVAPVVEVDGGWQAGYDSEGGEQALQFYLDALFDYRVDSPEVVSDAEGFGLGAGSIFQRESWVIGYLEENAPDINYGTCLMVKGPNDWGTVGSQSVLAVPASSENKEVAFDFIEFALSEDNQIKLLADTGWLPVRTDADYSSIYAEKPAFETFINSLNTPGYNYYSYPRIAPSLEIVGKLADSIVPTFSQPELVDQPERVTEIIDQMAEETNRILEDNDLLAK